MGSPIHYVVARYLEHLIHVDRIVVSKVSVRRRPEVVVDTQDAELKSKFESLLEFVYAYLMLDLVL